MAQGARGYSCSQRGVARCRGQSVSEAQAGRAVRALLGGLLPRLADLTQHVQAMLATEEAEDLSGKMRAFDILDRLEDLRIELLTGALSREKLTQLSQVVSAHRGDVTDPRLAEVLDEIDLRAQVELAKYDSGARSG